MKFLGVDPGLSGAFVILGEHGDLRFFDTPTQTVKSGKKLRHTMDCAEIVSVLTREFEEEGCVMVALERVAAMPGQGVSSMFSFGMGFGMWQGILCALKMPYTLVHSTSWKSKLMRDMGKEKEASIVRAKQLYPQAADRLSRKKDNGRADALLLAHYAKLYLSEPQPAKAASNSLF
jgi:crossover junction endodeoxyribonuclease RuvC